MSASEPQQGDVIRARRYGNTTLRTYVIDEIAPGFEGGASYTAWCHPLDTHGKLAKPTLMVFDRTGLRIIREGGGRAVQGNDPTRSTLSHNLAS